MPRPAFTTVLLPSAPGAPMAADVHLPPGPGPHPAILWIHGGALIGGRRTDLAPAQLERYLGAGLAVVTPDYPLAPESPPEAIADGVINAWAWLTGPDAERMGVDPTRTALVGHSAGGYLALQVGPRLTPRPRALVSFYGYGDVAGDWYATPSAHYRTGAIVTREDALAALASAPPAAADTGARMPFYLHCRQHGTWIQEVLRLDPVGDAAALDEWCPVRHVPADHPRTLLLHGDADDDVPVEESRAMAEALERAGIDLELVVLPGRGHGFDTDGPAPDVDAALDRAVTFLAEALA